MRKFLTLFLGASFLLLLTGGMASASLIGDSIDAGHTNGSYNYGASYTADVNATDMLFYWGAYSVDVVEDAGLATITVEFIKDTDFSSVTGFQGLLVDGLNDSSGNVLAGTTSSWGATDSGDDWVSFNFAGESFSAGDQYVATLDFGAVIDDGGGDPGDGGSGDGGGGGNTMANPVPAPILLLGTGLVGLAGFRKRNRK